MVCLMLSVVCCYCGYVNLAYFPLTFLPDEKSNKLNAFLGDFFPHETLSKGNLFQMNSDYELFTEGHFVQMDWNETYFIQ